MTNQEYKRAIAKVFQIEAVLMTPARRKDTRLILLHMALCGQIHRYELIRQRALDALRGKAA